MFRSIKAKLTAVKEDVTAGIKSVSNSVSSRVTNDGKSQVHGEHLINESSYSSQSDKESPSEHSDAAQNLLHGYEVTWEELYTTTANNFKKSKVVAKDLHSLQTASAVCTKKWEEFQNEMRELPSMLSTIQEITDQIVELHGHCALIEDGLVVLQNLHEEAEMEKAKHAERERLHKYEVEKKKQLVEFSERLANVHRKNVIATELREAELRREKELFYKKAFEEDMKRFKAEQTLKHNRPSLTQVTIEPNVEEAQNLEEFLNEEKAVEGVGNVTVDAAINNPTLKRTSIESSDSELNNSLEWDENGDTINITDDTPELDNSLDLEISRIVQGSAEHSVVGRSTSDNQNQVVEAEESPASVTGCPGDQPDKVKQVPPIPAGDLVD